MDEKQEKLKEVMEEIANKYKNRKLLYQKLQKAINIFKRCKTTNPQTYKELANLTAKIDYGCSFEDGGCRRYRAEYYSKKKKAMCFCSECASSFGYFIKIFFNNYNDKHYIEKELLYYTKKYSINTGFWRKGKGCILPRCRRSGTCLSYNCSDRLTKEERLIHTLLYSDKHIDYIDTLIHMLKDYFLYRKD